MSVITSMDINGGEKINALIFSKAVKANKKTTTTTQSSVLLIQSIKDPEQCRKEKGFGNIQRHFSSFWPFFSASVESWMFESDDSLDLILNATTPNIKEYVVRQHVSVT